MIVYIHEHIRNKHWVDRHRWHLQTVAAFVQPRHPARDAAGASRQLVLWAKVCTRSVAVELCVSGSALIATHTSGSLRKKNT